MTWVFAAFLAVWIAVFIFLVRIGQAQRVLFEDIESLKTTRRPRV